MFDTTVDSTVELCSAQDHPVTHHTTAVLRPICKVRIWTMVGLDPCRLLLFRGVCNPRIQASLQCLLTWYYWTLIFVLYLNILSPNQRFRPVCGLAVRPAGRAPQCRPVASSASGDGGQEHLRGGRGGRREEAPGRGSRFSCGPLADGWDPLLVGKPLFSRGFQGMAQRFVLGIISYNVVFSIISFMKVSSNFSERMLPLPCRSRLSAFGRMCMHSDVRCACKRWAKPGSTFP